LAAGQQRYSASITYVIKPKNRLLNGYCGVASYSTQLESAYCVISSGIRYSMHTVKLLVQLSLQSC
jgi:hypothetical protein